MLLFKDESHQYFLKVSQGKVSVVKVETRMVRVPGQRPTMEDASTELASAPIGNFKFVDLKVTSDGDSFGFWFAPNGKNWTKVIDGVDAQFLTTLNAGGFTGTLIGLYAEK
jgi:alpha-N-arabinofuranosidase